MNLSEQQKQLQRVVCAAIRFEVEQPFTDEIVDENKIYCCNPVIIQYVTVLGARHFDSWMRDQINKLKETQKLTNQQQGFIDQFGNFLTRSEALVIATEKNQIICKEACTAKELFSEALY